MAFTVADAQRVVDESGFGPWWGFVVESVGEGVARVRLPIRPELLRPGGVLQGAASMCTADVALWLAIAAVEGRPATCVTLEEKTTYLRGARSDITSEARLLKSGRRFIYGEASTYDAAGELVAHHVLTYVRVDG